VGLLYGTQGRGKGKMNDWFNNVVQHNICVGRGHYSIIVSVEKMSGREKGLGRVMEGIKWIKIKCTHQGNTLKIDLEIINKSQENKGGTVCVGGRLLVEGERVNKGN